MKTALFLMATLAIACDRKQELSAPSFNVEIHPPPNDNSYDIGSAANPFQCDEIPTLIAGMKVKNVFCLDADNHLTKNGKIVTPDGKLKQ